MGLGQYWHSKKKFHHRRLKKIWASGANVVVYLFVWFLLGLHILKVRQTRTRTRTIVVLTPSTQHDSKTRIAYDSYQELCLVPFSPALVFCFCSCASLLRLAALWGGFDDISWLCSLLVQETEVHNNSNGFRATSCCVASSRYDNPSGQTSARGTTGMPSPP